MPTINGNAQPTRPSTAIDFNVENPTRETIGAMFSAYSKDGWNDSELRHLVKDVVKTGDVQPYINSVWGAVLTPTMPKEDHKDQKFFEVLAWYIDKSTTQSGDGKLTLEDVQESLEKYGQQYLQLSQDPAQSVSRLQAWKFIQKLRILEKEIGVRAERGEGAFYPYSPRAMMEIDGNTDFNRENTIRSRDAFNEKVIDASFDKPVLVKYGLTYCAHCLLLEQLGSVPAVAEKYADDMDVFKLWWNPHDEMFNDLNAIAGENGVTSSPVFILYKDGEIVKSGYAFPDEKGEGMEDFLGNHVA